MIDRAAVLLIRAGSQLTPRWHSRFACRFRRSLRSRPRPSGNGLPAARARLSRFHSEQKVPSAADQHLRSLNLPLLNGFAKLTQNQMELMTRTLAGRRILVVHDDFFPAADLQHFLEGEGCTVAGPAPSVEGAVSCLLEGLSDAAILDVDLEAEGSAPVAAELQAAGVPFLVLSGSGPESAPPEHAGQALIGKPWSQGELRPRLHDVLSQADRRRRVPHAPG